MPDVYEHAGDNPPGLDVLSKHETVVWKHPQHGWLRASKNGSFTPIAEADVMRLRTPVPPPKPETAVSAAPTVPTGARGAGSSAPNLVSGMSVGERADERTRAKAEAGVQSAVDRAKFAAPERVDPLAGLGLAERAEVARLVREGKTQEEAAAVVKGKRAPAAGAQAEALRQ